MSIVAIHTALKHQESENTRFDRIANWANIIVHQSDFNEFKLIHRYSNKRYTLIILFLNNGEKIVVGI